MRKEYQIKIAGKIDTGRLIELGAEPLGQVVQKDAYLAGEITWRIREENGQFILTQKGHDIGDRASVKDVDEYIITHDEVHNLFQKRKVRVMVFKNRSLFQLDGSVVTIDEVEHLGNFVEIRSSDEDTIFKMMKVLGFKEEQILRESYLDMMIRKKLPKWLRMILRFHEKVGEMTFGITSGVLTTGGMLVGMNSATSSRLAVIAAILTVAIADSCSDAFGMYMSKTSERGCDKKAALRYAAGTLLGKCLIPSTFIVPLLLLPLETGVLAALGWGIIVLTALSVETAAVKQTNPLSAVSKNLGLAAIIILLSFAVGELVAKFLN